MILGNRWSTGVRKKIYRKIISRRLWFNTSWKSQKIFVEPH